METFLNGVNADLSSAREERYAVCLERDAIIKERDAACEERDEAAKVMTEAKNIAMQVIQNYLMWFILMIKKILILKK